MPHPPSLWKNALALAAGFTPVGLGAWVLCVVIVVLLFWLA